MRPVDFLQFSFSEKKIPKKMLRRPSRNQRKKLCFCVEFLFFYVKTVPKRPKKNHFYRKYNNERERRKNNKKTHYSSINRFSDRQAHQF